MFLALRDLKRGGRRFVLVGSVVALVAVLSTVLAGLARGLVDDGISGLRALPIDHLAFAPHSEASFTRSTLDDEALRPWESADGVEATPIGVTFLNARSTSGTEAVDLAVFGITEDSYLLPNAEARASMHGEPGLVLSEELRDEGVEVGQRFKVAGTDLELPVLGFTFAGTYGHVDIAYTSMDTWREITYRDRDTDRFSALAIRTTGDDVDLAAVDRRAGTDTITRTAAYDGSPGYTAETMTMTLIRTFLLVIAALVIGAFFTVLSIQRTRQIGLLKALGATDGYVVRDGVGQMALVVTAATAVGTLIGIGALALMRGGNAPVTLDVRGIAFSALALILAGIAGSLVAFRRVTKVEPAIALGVEP